MNVDKKYKESFSNVIQSKQGCRLGFVDNRLRGVAQAKLISGIHNGKIIQYIGNMGARFHAMLYGLNYEEIVLPALKTYFFKRHLVDEDAERTIADVPKEEYLGFLEQLKTKGNYAGASFATGGTWFRGFGLAHYSYRVFKETGGILCGEGLVDILEWTMGGSNTRWLPGALEPQICIGGALSLAKYLKAGYPTIAGYPNIVGVIVKKDLSADNPAFYKYDPYAECAIRGPQKVELAYLVNESGDLIHLVT